MKFRKSSLLLFVITVTVFFPGCELIAGIFQAGVWTGVIAIVVVIALLIWGIRALMK